MRIPHHSVEIAKKLVMAMYIVKLSTSYETLMKAAMSFKIWRISIDQLA
jgi:AmiR/NasT family two-component response regulator